MELLTSEDISDHITNIIHAGTQQHERCMDLTVDRVEQMTEPGSLDFGGSEFEAAGTEPISPEKKNADDDYGWWRLESGTYRVTCNEQLSTDEETLALITPHEHAREAGMMINTQVVQSSGAISLTVHVPSAGINIKENARVATAHLFEVRV